MLKLIIEKELNGRISGKGIRTYQTVIISSFKKNQIILVVLKPRKIRHEVGKVQLMMISEIVWEPNFLNRESFIYAFCTRISFYIP